MLATWKEIAGGNLDGIFLGRVHEVQLGGACIDDHVDHTAQAVGAPDGLNLRDQVPQVRVLDHAMACRQGSRWWM